MNYCGENDETDKSESASFLASLYLISSMSASARLIIQRSFVIDVSPL